ncbi:MAG TPA: hypothetical protein DCL35_01145 [Candidatus Omnitrophica bacterium]|nr:hypothetical protein [Candidatus Omnitrophota bacterium]
MAIDKDYLNLLTSVVESSIVNLSFRLHGEVLPSKIGSIIASRSKDVIRPPLTNRAGSVKAEGIRGLKPRRKSYGCLRNLRHNVLLPNGDVVLCCMDFGMKHVLGNLLVSDYLSLFSGVEFLKVKGNLKQDYGDILCNRCDGFSYNSILSFRTLFYFLVRLGDVRSLRYLRREAVRYLSFFRK